MPLSGFIVLVLLNTLLPAPVNPETIPALSFFRERVEVEVIDPGKGDEWALDVHGVYQFRRSGSLGTEKRARIFYPFPVGDGNHDPDEIRVSRPAAEGGRDPVAFHRATGGISIPVFFPAGRAATEITVDYRQRTGRPGGRYITKTTRAWEQPLERAEFVVRVPATLRLTVISYPPDRTEEIDGLAVSTITIDDFMPDQDLEIEWERRQ